MERPLALVVEGDPTVRASIRNAFEEHDVLTEFVESATDAMEMIGRRPVRIIFLDADAVGIDPLGVLRHTATLIPPPIVVASTARLESSVSEALFESGAFDILERPVDDRRLRLMVRKALRHQELIQEIRRFREERRSREGYSGIVGRTPEMERIRERLPELAAADSAVWLWGEAGTGKELVARTVHARSQRAGGRFSMVSCENLARESWDARFGLRPDGRPAADGFMARHRGGTVYFENLPALSPELQGRLLQTLEKTDARALFSSGSDPDGLIEQGRVLEEIGALAGIHRVGLPPLRRRVEDIRLLARHFVRTICEINRLPAMRLAPEVIGLLEAQSWPDNAQGLRNALEQAVIVSLDGRIQVQDLPDRLDSAGQVEARPGSEQQRADRRFREAKREVVEAFERSYLSDLMQQHGGNVTAASHQAGMLRSALQRLLRKYGLKSAEFRHRHEAQTSSGH